LADHFDLDLYGKLASLFHAFMLSCHRANGNIAQACGWSAIRISGSRATPIPSLPRQECARPRARLGGERGVAAGAVEPDDLRVRAEPRELPLGIPAAGALRLLDRRCQRPLASEMPRDLTVAHRLEGAAGARMALHQPLHFLDEAGLDHPVYAR